jgi:hypothetical protein
MIWEFFEEFYPKVIWKSFYFLFFIRQLIEQV